MAGFWDIAPGSVVEVGLRFRGASIIKVINHPEDGGSKHLWIICLL
jgi:hypothetical protein